MHPIDRARNYIHQNGRLVTRALFDYLFDNGSLDHLHNCLRAYKNDDGGFGHGFEHDIKAPASNALQLEYLLSTLTLTGVPIGNLLDGAADWVESVQQPDGSLAAPGTLNAYPHAAWWQTDGRCTGQTDPDSIVGHLTRLNLVTPTLAARTQIWVQTNLTEQHIIKQNWIFMLYHAHNYFFNVPDFPKANHYQDLVIHCVKTTLQKHMIAGKMDVALGLFGYVTEPDSPVLAALPERLVDKLLDYIEGSQQDDGRWLDEHNLAYWQPEMTLQNLCVLRNFGRI